MLISLNNNQTLHFPRDIEFTADSSFQTIRLHLKKPEANMQEDGSAFEAWSLILKLKTSCQKIELSFKEINIDTKRIFHNLNVSQRHYMRFLYRLSKFQQQMSSWFHVSSESKKILDVFEENFKGVIKINNIPDQKAQYNRKKGCEHVLEKGFVNIPSVRKENGIEFELFDQLPTGLFAENVSKENQIFNTGYFDLWGKDPTDETFALFELKTPANRKLGIISELFFYSNFAFDLLNERDNIKLNEGTSQYRGYQTLLSLKHAHVKSYFLIKNLHSEFEKYHRELLKMLNEHSPIPYDIIRYEMNEQSFSSIEKQLNEICF